MPLLGATAEDAALFVTYNQVQSLLRWMRGAPADSTSPLSELCVAAAASGAMAGLVLTPVELIKCKMQVQMMGRPRDAGALPSATSLILQTLRQDGVRGLFHGFSGTLLRETGGGIAWFLSFELATRELIALHSSRRNGPLLTKSDLGALELALCGAVAGISYNVSLFPADSIKSAMQTERELRGATAPRTGFFAMLLRIYRTRGVAGLYAGLGVTCLRSAPSSGT